MPRQTDAKTPDAKVEIGDFAGFAPNSDPHDIPPGAAIRQVNATSLRPGELRARPGVKIVQFE